MTLDLSSFYNKYVYAYLVDWDLMNILYFQVALWKFSTQCSSQGTEDDYVFQATLRIC